MTKEVNISIIGTQKNSDGEEVVEVKCKGLYYKKNNKHYILYEEKQSDSQSIEKNRIKITDTQVEIMKNGGSSLHMIFDEDKSWLTNYSTPFGDLEVGIETKQVCCVEQEDTIDLRISYSLEMNGSHLYDCVTEIRVVSL